MCGICGELSFRGQPDLNGLQRMNDRLAPRGPDHAGVYVEGPVAFGHRRLSIIDLSYHAHQPMIDSELSLALVFNGTIYNYRELRQELTALGYRFFSTGDTEVILKAYAAWGRDCVQRFSGMFAFAIWDIARQQLFIARDRFGIKPLYYSHDSQRFRFASSLPALLAGGGINTDFDPVALHHHFTLHAVVPAPRTILQGVRKVEPGTSLLIDLQGQPQPQRYWQLQAKRPAQNMSEQDWLEATETALKAAVKKRLLAADVPVGVLLSGGLDSSLLVALLAEAGQEKLLTFSIGFEDIGQERGSEFEYSDLVVERYQTQHQRYVIPNPQVLERLPEAIKAMSEPMVGQDAVAFYLLAERVSKDVKVVQSGQGADETFAGYFWYPRMHEASGDAVERFRQHYFDRDQDEYLAMMNPNYHGADYTAELVQERLNLPDADEYLDQVLRFDVTTLIVDDPVKRVDNMTMAWGLEARVPFLDHELVELAASMPPELKLREYGKYPLKALARKHLPAAVIDRPKGYFPMPALKYVRGEFYDFMRDTLLSDACRQRGLYQPAYVEKLLAEPETHFTRIQGSKLWHLALLESWLQIQEI